MKHQHTNKTQAAFAAISDGSRQLVYIYTFRIGNKSTANKHSNVTTKMAHSHSIFVSVFLFGNICIQMAKFNIQNIQTGYYYVYDTEYGMSNGRASKLLYKLDLNSKGGSM